MLYLMQVTERWFFLPMNKNFDFVDVDVGEDEGGSSMMGSCKTPTKPLTPKHIAVVCVVVVHVHAQLPFADVPDFFAWFFPNISQRGRRAHGNAPALRARRACMESPEKVAAGRHATKDSVHVDRLDRLRADGNAAFKAGNLQSAKRHYTAAISLAESMPDEPVEKLVPTRRAQLLANRCQVSLALEKVAEALSDAQAPPTPPRPHAPAP